MADASFHNFPFTAVAGQESLKLALILTAINPRIGGVLIAGPRGSAKSTLARGLAGVMPLQQDQETAFVTLPLGATEDRLLGSLDIEAVLNDKQVKFHPGLLAQADQGVLYVDEVNLLADSLVDVLLDVSASGVNRVERDGVSHVHEARFILVGTMNPEEGELRPQLQDRFGLMVSLSNDYSLEERVQIVRLRDEYDQDPKGFCDAFKYKQRNLRQSISQAKARLSSIKCADAIRMDIASRCQDAMVDGVRADIVWVRAAVAHAAWRGAQTVSVEDVQAVESFVLAHRRQASSPSKPSAPPSSPPPSRRPQDSLPQEEGPAPGKSLPSPQSESAGELSVGEWGSMPPERQLAVEAIGLGSSLFSEAFVPPERSVTNVLAGKQRGISQGGANLGKQPAGAIDVAQALRSSAGAWPPQQLVRRKARSGKAVLHCILLDTSGSTLSEQTFAKTKGMILEIASRAYLQREQISILGFGGDQVDWLLPQVRAPQNIRTQLDEFGAGGGTPIHQALDDAERYLVQVSRQQPELELYSYILTDGRVTGEFATKRWPGKRVVVDTELAAIKRGRARDLAQALQADYMTLSQLLT
ncbi:Magnesium-chelatase 38 kDa subunit [Marinomonas aquimarina]|uniref:Magnesium-chelatase 38 kDa subunit n=1 Tax=Marinomonas aquimarina TaxID=295068 RepID=A0A1A8T831_9GAMM|nr:AAA family ATPase [Marinomonas aquimarina]SBS28787.1 Magnesium-chelatase 38 kDa subunit [Marinomonas aquimarina]